MSTVTLKAAPFVILQRIRWVSLCVFSLVKGQVIAGNSLLGEKSVGGILLLGVTDRDIRDNVSLFLILLHGTDLP